MIPWKIHFIESVSVVVMLICIGTVGRFDSYITIITSFGFVMSLKCFLWTRDERKRIKKEVNVF